VEIISHCVWLYHHFPLSLREIQEMMMARGVLVAYETIHQWCRKFGQTFTNGEEFLLLRDSSNLASLPARTSLAGSVALTDDVLGQVELMRRHRRRVPPPLSGFAGFRFCVSRTLKGA